MAVRQHLSTSMRLDSVQELRVSLLRHWSLYEALYHSSYIASRLGLYQGLTVKQACQYAGHTRQSQPVVTTVRHP